MNIGAKRLAPPLGISHPFVTSDGPQTDPQTRTRNFVLAEVRDRSNACSDSSCRFPEESLHAQPQNSMNSRSGSKAALARVGRSKGRPPVRQRRPAYVS